MRPELGRDRPIVASILSATHRLEGAVEQFKAEAQPID